MLLAYQSVGIREYTRILKDTISTQECMTKDMEAVRQTVGVPLAAR